MDIFAILKKHKDKLNLSEIDRALGQEAGYTSRRLNDNENRKFTEEDEKAIKSYLRTLGQSLNNIHI